MIMKRILMVILAGVMMISAFAQEFNPVPRSWKWIGDSEVEMRRSSSRIMVPLRMMLLLL